MFYKELPTEKCTVIKNAIDSFQIRELGKKLSDTFESFKQKHNIK